MTDTAPAIPPRLAGLAAGCWLVLAAAGLSLPVQAGGASAWGEGFHAKARLIAGAPAPGGSELVAGVHLRLEKGWKTYWRSPGDSGLPPAFDWSRSTNVKAARVLWPAPQRFTDPSGSYVGYAEEVVFPVMVEPLNAEAPVELALDLDYAICREICVPVQAALSLRLPPRGSGAGEHGNLIARYLRTVPKQANGDGASLPRLSRVEASLAAPRPALVVEAQFPRDAKQMDMLIEGPSQFYFPPPEPVGVSTSGAARFTVDLSKSRGLERLSGAMLTVTLLSDRGSTETSWTLD